MVVRTTGVPVAPTYPIGPLRHGAELPESREGGVLDVALLAHDLHGVAASGSSVTSGAPTTGPPGRRPGGSRTGSWGAKGPPPDHRAPGEECCMRTCRTARERGLTGRGTLRRAARQRSFGSCQTAGERAQGPCIKGTRHAREEDLLRHLPVGNRDGDGQADADEERGPEPGGVSDNRARILPARSLRERSGIMINAPRTPAAGSAR